MTSYIICSKDLTKREQYIQKFIDNKQISHFDVLSISLTSITSPSTKSTKQSIGIEEIKQLQRNLLLKPVQGKEKMAIIEDAQLLTTEAQNALLKTLEEPPANTYILLSSETIESLLPTILSRCNIIEIHQPIRLSEKEQEEQTNLLLRIPTLTYGEALLLAESTGKNKVQALKWLESMMIIAHQHLRDDLKEYKDYTFLISLLRSLQETHKIISGTNSNLRLTLENFFLNITPQY